MLRVDCPEILDSDACPLADVAMSMRDMGMVNRWFGGIATTQTLVERIARSCDTRRLSLLEVAAGSGELPRKVRQNLAQRGIALDITLLDRARSHFSAPCRMEKARTDAARTSHIPAVAADALALPFRDGTFDVVSCNLFAHHLNPILLPRFLQEGLRVSRRALLINDLVRARRHLALAYASRPLMRSRVAWLDGLTSVRRAYLPEEVRALIAQAAPSSNRPRIDITRHYLFRMGLIVWK
jgi:ubiquinone/menaquinone biosynthesis C-methylase UbiE